MHVMVVTTGDITWMHGYTIRVVSEIAQLVKQGTEVELVCFVHVRELLQGRKGAGLFRRQMEAMGCRVTIVPAPPDFRKPLLVRAVEWYEALWLWLLARKTGAQLMHCHGHAAASVAGESRGLHRLPVVFDMHGAEVDERKQDTWPSDQLRRRTLARVARYEATALRGASAVVSVSDALRAYWQGRYRRSPALCLTVPCAMDPALFSFDPLARRQLREQWAIVDDAPLFVYSGNVHWWQQVDKVIEVFAAVRRRLPAARILFLVPESEVPKLARLLEGAVLAAPTVLVASAAHRDVPRFLSAADMGFLLRQDLLLNHVASPTKFAEYLACGLPVVATRHVDSVAQAIAAGGVGYLVDVDSEASIAALAEAAAGVMAGREAWMARCRAYAGEHLSWERFGSKLVDLYARLVAPAPWPAVMAARQEGSGKRERMAPALALEPGAGDSFHERTLHDQEEHDDGQRGEHGRRRQVGPVGAVHGEEAGQTHLDRLNGRVVGHD
jgi:glycosyltransferase involved in cell wall biosynthesis